MIISLIAAMDSERGIGNMNYLPWRGKIPADMKHFRELTTGHAIIMGRKTYESLGRPLPNRRNIILSRSEFSAPDVEVFSSMNDALEAISGDKNTEVFIIGGAQLFETSIAAADRLYLTEIDSEFDCDTFFPEWRPEDWEIVTEMTQPKDEKNLYALSFITYARIK